MLTAVLGGAVGILLVAFARALGIPGELRANDAAAADRDEALATWAADRNHALRDQCVRIREGVPTHSDESQSETTGLPTVQEARARDADSKIASARSAALHEFRDESRRARLEVATILAAEGWAHRLARVISGRPSPKLTTPARAEPLLDAWRKPSAMSGSRQTWPDDATQRTLERAIAEMPVTGP